MITLALIYLSSKHASISVYVSLLAVLVTLILSFVSVFISSQQAKKLQIVQVEKIQQSFQEELIENNSEVSFDIETLVQEVKSCAQLSESLEAKCNKALSILSKKLEIGQAVIFKKVTQGEKTIIKPIASYATLVDQNTSYEIGEGLVGMSVKENRKLVMNHLPKGFLSIFSGLGSAAPKIVLIHPISSGDEAIGVLEIASFHDLNKEMIEAIEHVSKSLIYIFDNE
jgi:hypothetical protein